MPYQDIQENNEQIIAEDLEVVVFCNEKDEERGKFLFKCCRGCKHNPITAGALMFDIEVGMHKEPPIWIAVTILVLWTVAIILASLSQKFVLLLIALVAFAII